MRNVCPGSHFNALVDFVHVIQTCTVLCIADAFMSGNEHMVAD